MGLYYSRGLHMEAAFGWLGDLIRALVTILPRLSLIQSDERGVLYTFGRVKELKPGLHMWWPLWSHLAKCKVTRDTIHTSYQSLATKDDAEITVAVTIIFTIADAVTAVAKVSDFQGAVVDIVGVVVKRLVIQREWQQLKNEQVEVDKLLSRRCRKRLAPYGVAVKSAYISELAKPYNVRLMQSQG